MSTSRTTTDHEAIKSWTEERGGHPAVVRATKGKGGNGVLRIDFPGYSGEDTLETVSWDEFFDVFDKNKLAFLCQDETAEGKTSRFFKLVDRDEDEGKKGRA